MNQLCSFTHSTEQSKLASCVLPVNNLLMSVLLNRPVSEIKIQLYN